MKQGSIAQGLLDARDEAIAALISIERGEIRALKFGCTPSVDGLESEASCGQPDAAVFAFSEEVNLREILKLLRLGAKVRLGGVKVFRRGPESFVFRNRQQILEVAKLGPIVHTSTLRTAGMSILSMTEASRPLVARFRRSNCG
jgi:hypothetical protein